MTSKYLSAFMVALSISAAACSGSPFGDCTDELRVNISPRDTSVAIGAAFQAKVALSTCGGDKRLTDTFTWMSVDPAIARVGAADGRVTAVAPGETTIEVTGARYGEVATIRIAVTPW